MKALSSLVKKTAQWLSGCLKLINLSIQIKILCSYVLLFLVPVVIFLSLFNMFAATVKHNEMQMIDQTNRQAIENINSYADDLLKLTAQPLYNANVMDELQALRDNTAYRDSVANNMDLYNTLNSIRSYKPSIHSVFLFDSHGNTLSHYIAHGQLTSPYVPMGELWYNQCLRMNGSAMVSGVYSIPGILPEEPLEKRNLFVACRAVIDIDSLDIAGTLAIFSSMDELRDICLRLMTFPGEIIFIIDRSNTVIFSTQDSFIGKPLPEELPDIQDADTINGNRMQEVTLLDGARYFWMDIHAAVPDWRLIRMIPEDVIYAGQREVQNGFLLTAVILASVCVPMAFIMSSGITRPIRKITNMMQFVEKGDFSVRFKVKYRDEIGQLGKGFNSMLAKVDSLIHDVYIADLRKKEAELTALQAQINPHFIYNTLESIRMAARVDHNKEIADMIFVLGNLLRYSINTKNRIVSVQEELEHLQNYMRLQNHRSDNKFVLNINIPQSFYDLFIIKLIFQPIVENCIYHALEIVEGQGTVTISGLETDTGICFRVEDNGVGMSENELEKLVRRMNDFGSGGRESRGVGLRNVNERIKLFYGVNYGISVSSSLESGTTVTLHLPSRNDMNAVSLVEQTAGTGGDFIAKDYDR